jgi:hypothetical protein
LFIYLLPIYIRFDPRIGRYEKSEMLWVFFVFIIYEIILSTEIKYTLFPKLVYPIIFKIEKEIHV